MGSGRTSAGRLSSGEIIMNFKLGAVAALALATALGGCVSINVNEADEKVDVAPMPSALVGTWDVSLYSDPNAEPSKTEFVVTEVTAARSKMAAIRLRAMRSCLQAVLPIFLVPIGTLAGCAPIQSSKARPFLTAAIS
eukprot:gene16651-22762_t